MQAGGQRFDPANLHQTGPELSWLERTTDNRKVGGSSPLGPTNLLSMLSHGGIAQMGERLLCTQEVSGSNPLISTIKIRFKRSEMNA